MMSTEELKKILRWMELEADGESVLINDTYLSLIGYDLDLLKLMRMLLDRQWSVPKKRGSIYVMGRYSKTIHEVTGGTLDEVILKAVGKEIEWERQP